MVFNYTTKIGPNTVSASAIQLDNHTTDYELLLIGPHVSFTTEWAGTCMGGTSNKNGTTTFRCLQDLTWATNSVIEKLTKRVAMIEK